MKKLNALLLMALCAVFSFTSCNDDSNDSGFGITGVTVTTAEGASYNGVIDYSGLTIQCTVPMTTQASELEACSLNVTATMNTTVTVNGAAVAGATFDLNNPIVLTATHEGSSKDYTLTVVISDTEDDLAAGKQISADIRGGGIPGNVYDYSVALFDGKFYAFTSGYDAADTLGFYKVFTSTTGIRWTEVSTEDIIGGMGARPIVINDKLYVIGGIRVLGTDQGGNAPELESNGWSTSLTLKSFRIASTGNGSTWNDESIEGNSTLADDMFKMLIGRGSFGFVCPTPFTYNNNLYMESGVMMAFGMFQGANSQMWMKADTTYTMVSGASSFLRAHCSTFVLNNEIFLLGGSRGFVGASNLQSAVAKSTDGENFATVADSTAVGPICGATVVTNNAGNTAYLFGGLYYDEAGARVMNNTIYKSTDGVTWTAVEGINEAYTGTFNPCVVVDENDIAWVFGGFNSFSGNYTPYSTTVDDMDPSFAAWAFALN